MDYNTTQQYPTPPHGSFNESSTFRPHSTPVMYSYGSFPQDNQRGAAQSHSSYQQSPQTQNVHQQQQTRRNSQPVLWNSTSHGIVMDKLQDGTQVKQDDSNTHATEATDQSAMHQISFPSQSINHLGFQHHFTQPNLFKSSLDSSPMKTSIAEIDLNELAWNSKSFDTIEFPRLEPDSTDMGYPYIAQDEEGPIIIRPFYGTNAENEILEIPHNPRRISDSSLSFSSSGAVPDVTCFEDVPASEPAPRGPESGGWDTAQTHSSLLSPLPSPRREGDISRIGNRSRASPSQHGSKRSSPYSIDKNRLKRWTTGNVASSSMSVSISPRPMSHMQDRYTSYNHQLFNGHNVASPYTPNPLGIYPLHQQHQQHVLYSQQHHNLQNGNSILFTPSEQPFQLEIPRPVPSQGLFPLLQSNADRHGGCSTHFADLSDPPDLYSSLHEEPSNPPESDMNPSDPDLVPHEQDLRFTGDLYTPRWVRGHGNKREGWCGLCKPGRWLVLKNSAFWYDKSFTHGVSAATGAAFQSPRETRRTDGNLDVWEGLCGSCNDWIALVSSKKKGTTWFRHAYKCHTHPKVKDGPKRRRETSHQIRARTVSSASTTTTASYPISKESSHDPPTLSDRVLETDTDRDSKAAAESSIRNVTNSSHDSSRQISTNQLGGLGRVTSIFANLV